MKKAIKLFLSVWILFYFYIVLTLVNNNPHSHFNRDVSKYQSSIDVTFDAKTKSSPAETDDQLKDDRAKGNGQQIATSKTAEVKASVNTSECKERVPKLSEKPLPLTALISFPGAGSTWVRHLIQQMTGGCPFEWFKWFQIARSTVSTHSSACKSGHCN